MDIHLKIAGDRRSGDISMVESSDHGLDIARRRVGVSGTIRGIVEFEVDAELDGGPAWRDVFVNYRQFGAAQVQAGRFKLPFSLDENTGAANLDFVYRSRAANQLAPGRDVGVMLHGRVLGRTVGYEAGVFHRDGSNARTSDDEGVSGARTIASRLTIRPFRRAGALNDLQLGVAMTQSDLDQGFSDLRGRMALGPRFFRPNVWVQGERHRRGFEARWRPGPFSIKAEWLRVLDERRGQSVEDGDLAPLVGSGWYVSGTWLITGEGKASGPIRPRRPLFPFGGGYGAVELAVRLEQLEYSSGGDGEAPSDSPRANTIRGNADRVVTVGANWHLSRWVKLQFNVIRDHLADSTQGPVQSQSTFWSRVLRVQVAL